MGFRWVIVELQSSIDIALFGVLKYKKMVEDFLRELGIPYTVITFLSSI
jgi:hypothetical protein